MGYGKENNAFQEQSVVKVNFTKTLSEILKTSRDKFSRRTHTHKKKNQKTNSQLTVISSSLLAFLTFLMNRFGML